MTIQEFRQKEKTKTSTESKKLLEKVDLAQADTHALQTQLSSSQNILIVKYVLMS